jgi:hypothetical protein
MEEPEQNADKNSKPEKGFKLSVFLLKKRSNKFFKIAGLFIVSACLYILMFTYSEPTIDTDYLAQLNQINKPPNYKEEDNAWPYYQKAFELLITPNQLGDINDSIYTYQPNIDKLNEKEKKFVTDWIEQNKASWLELEKAIQKPYCYIKYTIRETQKDDGNPFNEYAPELNAPTLKIELQYTGKLRLMTILYAWRIEIENKNKNPQQAIEDCLTMLNCSLHWQKNKTYAEEIWVWLLNSYSCEGLLKVLSTNDFSADKLRDIQEKLTNIYKSYSFKFIMDCEKILFLDIVQSMFTKGGLGGGHIIPKYISSLAPMTFAGSILSGGEPIKQTTQEKIQFVAMSLLHARRNKTISKYDQIFEQLQQIQKMTPYEIKQSNIQIDIPHFSIWKYQVQLKTFPKESRFLVISAMTHGSADFAEIVHMDRSVMEAIITILALKRYKLENGEYPETLDELLNKEYITSIPMDPFCDKPLTYKKTDTDFTLYSVGRDFKDDGGISVFSNSGSVVKWGNSYNKKGGDTIFWPLQ